MPFFWLKPLFSSNWFFSIRCLSLCLSFCGVLKSIICHLKINTNRLLDSPHLNYIFILTGHEGYNLIWLFLYNVVCSGYWINKTKTNFLVSWPPFACIWCWKSCQRRFLLYRHTNGLLIGFLLSKRLSKPIAIKIPATVAVAFFVLLIVIMKIVKYLVCKNNYLIVILWTAVNRIFAVWFTPHALIHNTFFQAPLKAMTFILCINWPTKYHQSIIRPR